MTLLTRSRVKIYVNGSLIKDEIMPAGNYKLQYLPLMNGLNFVRVVIENEFGGRKVLSFNLPTSISIRKLKSILEKTQKALSILGQ